MRRDAVKSRPTLCLRGCHTHQVMHQRDGVHGREFYCLVCDASYPVKFWKILPQKLGWEKRAGT